MKISRKNIETDIGTSKFMKIFSSPLAKKKPINLNLIFVINLSQVIIVSIEDSGKFAL